MDHPGVAICLPTADAAVFTTALVPYDEAGYRFAIAGFASVLDDVGLTTADAVALATTGVRSALDGRVLTKRELGGALAPHMPPALRSWFDPDTFSRFSAMLVRPVGTLGVFCFAPRGGNEASFVRTDQWLGRATVDVPREQARTELVRRYLRCYGPSDADRFGEWAGIDPGQARRTWRLVEDALVEVDCDGRRGHVREPDIDALASQPLRNRRPVPASARPAAPVTGPGDARARSGPARADLAHMGNPGGLLVDGRMVAVWRARKNGTRMTVTVEPFESRGVPDPDAVRAEADALAPFRGCRSVEMTISGP